MNEFQRREELGREALKQLKKLYPNHFKYDLHFTTNVYECYDAYYFIKEDGSIKKRVWIEIKIRDVDYPDYLLEQKKIQALNKKRDELFLNKDEVDFIYINFTPTKTIIWNITNVDTENTTQLYANKATSISRKYKINKNVIMLKPSDGIVLDYKIDK